MDDIADAMIDGMLCETCGEFLTEDPPGYPQRCGGCEPDNGAEDLLEELINCLAHSAAQKERDHGR